jgi:hypothetical protein
MSLRRHSQLLPAAIGGAHDSEAARFQLIAHEGQFDLIVVHNQNAERSASRQRFHASRDDPGVNGVGC